MPEDWIVQCFMSPPTQYRLYGRRYLQVKRPNQHAWGSLKFISKANGVYKKDYRYAFRMYVVEEIFQIKSCIEILMNDIEVDATDQYS